MNISPSLFRLHTFENNHFFFEQEGSFPCEQGIPRVFFIWGILIKRTFRPWR